MNSKHDRENERKHSYSFVSMSNNEVMEATAALKGMLGIGKKNMSVKSSNAQTPKNDVKGKEGGDYAPFSPDSKASAKKKKVKKHKKNSKAQNGPSSSSTTSGNQKSQPPSQKQQQYQQAEKKHPKGKKISQFQTPPNNSSKGKKKQNSNFAWSAFQSPPDASALPLPSFSGSDLFPDTQISENTPQPPPPPQPSSLLSQDTTNQEKIVDLNTVAKSVEQLENEVIAAAKAAAVSKKLSDEKKIPQEEKEENVPNKSKKQSAHDNYNPKSVKKDTESNAVSTTSNEPTSQSGVNLAALTSPSSRGPEPVVQSPVPNLSMNKLMNVSNSKQTQSYNPTQSTLHQNTQQPNPYSSPQHHHFSRHPPQIVTIQVQIPPVLLPGRQMMVHTPAGYPIAVVVPENMRPGMIIPVNVPAPMNYPPPPTMGPSPHMTQQHPPNAFRYRNPNSLPPHQQHPHLQVTPHTQGQDPYYPNSSSPYNHPKSGQHPNTTYTKK